MKKTIVAFLIFLFSLVNTMLPVFAAATPSYDFYCGYETKEEGVVLTREIAFIYYVKDFKNFKYQYPDGEVGQDGTNGIELKLEYDENVFDTIQIKYNEDGNYAGIETMTTAKRPAIEALSSWGNLTYNPETKELVVQNSNFVNYTDPVFQITLRVKPEAPLGKTTIKLKEILATDRVKDYSPVNGDIVKEVEILTAFSDPIDPDPENGFGGYIRISPDMKTSELKLANPLVKGDIKNAQGTILADDDYVSTGSTVKEGDLSYTFIAVGDINSDGKLSVTDLSRISAYNAGEQINLTDDEKRACDICYDAKLSIIDLSRLVPFSVGLIDINPKLWEGEPGKETCFPVQFVIK